MSRPVRVAVLGGGSRGSTVASLVAANAPTVLWARNADLVIEINERHTNTAYLPDLRLHPQVTATDSLEGAVRDADALVVVDLARLHGIEMPIAREVDAVVNHGRPVREAFRGLGRTPPTSEIHGVA